MKDQKIRAEKKRPAKKTGQKRKGGSPPRGRRGPYPFEFRLQAVKMCLDDGYSRSLVCEQMGMLPAALRDQPN